MGSFIEDIIDWLREFLRRLQEWLEELFGYGNYRPPWHWDRENKRWIYGGSEDGYPLPGGGTGEQKSYVCTESVIARIEGRGPNAGDVGVDTDEVEERLRRLGWVPGECNCGCGEGQSRNCVVLYVLNGDVFHAAIFDHARCDWGSKLSAGGPIARFKRARDYLDGSPAGSRMVFYCPGPPGSRPGGGDPVVPRRQLTDEQLHGGAH